MPASPFASCRHDILNAEGSKKWFCLRARPKREHMAAAGLRPLEDVEVFSPRIRFQRPTTRGKVWFQEALFPGYLFARFDPERRLRAVQYAHGVTGLVRFGDAYAEIPPEALRDLRAEVGQDETRTICQGLDVGDEARVLDGPFSGLEVVVTHPFPARERVRVLLEFLGRQMEVELSTSIVCSVDSDPRSLAWPDRG